MSNRLLGIPLWVAVGGLIGLLAAIGLYPSGLGAPLPRYPLSESEICDRARELARRLGHPGAEASTYAFTLRNDFHQLSRAIGVEDARRLAASGEVPVATWRVRFRDRILFSSIDGDPAGLTLSLAPNGDVLAVDLPGKTPAEPAPSRATARQIAVRRLAELGVSLEGFTERTRDGETAARREDDEDEDEDDEARVRTSRPESGGARVTVGDGETAERPNEEKFAWVRPDPVHSGVTHQVKATVTAGGLREYSRSFTADGASDGSRLGDVLEGTGFVLCVLALALTILGVGVFRLVARDYVSLRRAFAAQLVFALLCAVSLAIMLDFGGALYAVPIKAFGLAISIGVFVGFAWLVGETDAYRAWGKGPTEGLLAIFTLRPHARQVAREALEGTLAGWMMIGALAVAGASVAALGGPGAIRRSGDLFAVDARPTVLFPLGLLPYAFASMVTLQLFAAARTQRILKRPWLWGPVAALVIGLVALPEELADIELGALSSSLSWSLAFGAVSCVLVARRGVLTAGVAAFVFTTFYYGLAAATGGAPADALAASAGLVLAAAPAGLALVAGPWLPEVEVREAPTPRMTSLLEQARRAEELNIAQRVQSGLLPSTDPEVEGFDVAGRCVPASEVGGDYFDYFRLPEGRFGIAVGDVSGKGVPAAFFMTLTKGFMEVAAAESRSSSEALSKANGYLRDHLAKGTFVTMAYATIDLESRLVTLARAGHNLPILARRGEPARLLETSGVALGAAPPVEFERLIEPADVEVRPGDLLVFYTDGLTEAMSPAREQFGEERLLEAVDRLRDGRPARDLLDALFAEVSDFSAGASQHDDITIVVVKVG